MSHGTGSALILGAAVALMFVALGCGEPSTTSSSVRDTRVPAPQTGDPPQQPSASTAPQRPLPPADASFSAYELVRHFKEDKDALKKKYERKILDVSGVVDIVKKGEFGPAYLTFQQSGKTFDENPTGSLSDRVYVALTDPEPWARYCPRQEVTVRGTGHFDYEPALVDSVVVKAGPCPAIVLSADELTREYAADPKAALGKYIKHFFRISGVVEGTEENAQTKFVRLFLKGKDKCKVACGFNIYSFQRVQALSSKPGDNVTVYGQLFLSDLSESDKIELSECYLITGKE